MENLASATGLLWTTVTLSSLTCEEGGNLSTRDLGFMYVSSEGQVGGELKKKERRINKAKMKIQVM